MTRRGRWIVGGAVVVLGLSAAAGHAQDTPTAKVVDCAKPIQPCTACHNAELAQAYAKCLMTRWEAPLEAKELKPPFPVTPEVIRVGKTTYEIYCDGCHGPAGDGKGHVALKLGVPAINIGAPVVQAQTDGELFWKISTGRGAMPAWGALLPEEMRWQLADYVRTFKGAAAK
jgi:mono/diheme cytochrome c family protein